MPSPVYPLKTNGGSEWGSKGCCEEAVVINRSLEYLGNAAVRRVGLQELAQEYQPKTDEELLRLALDPAQLTPEANSVLNKELSRRRINSKERLRTFRVEEAQRKEEQRKHTRKLFVIHPYGIGRKRFGKAECTTRKREQQCSLSCFGFRLYPLAPFSWSGSARSFQTKLWFWKGFLLIGNKC